MEFVRTELLLNTERSHNTPIFYSELESGWVDLVDGWTHDLEILCEINRKFNPPARSDGLMQSIIGSCM